MPVYMFRLPTDSFALLAPKCRLQATAVAQGAIRPSGVTADPRAMYGIATG